MVSHNCFLRSVRSDLPLNLGLQVDVSRFLNGLDPNSLTKPQQLVQCFKSEGCYIRPILATNGYGPPQFRVHLVIF